MFQHCVSQLCRGQAGGGDAGQGAGDVQGEVVFVLLPVDRLVHDMFLHCQ